MVCGLKFGNRLKFPIRFEYENQLSINVHMEMRCTLGSQKARAAEDSNSPIAIDGLGMDSGDSIQMRKIRMCAPRNEVCVTLQMLCRAAQRIS